MNIPLLERKRFLRYNNFMRVSREVSELNTLKILHTIWQAKKISRIEIASILKLDKSTVTKTVTALAKKNIVLETEFGSAKPQGGRKPVFLEMNGNFLCTAGIQIEQNQIRVCLVNLCGAILYESVLQQNKNAISVLQKAAERLRIKIAAIGVGSPNLLSVEKFLDTKTANSTPIFLETPAACGCYAEQFSLNANALIIYVYIDENASSKNANTEIAIMLEGKIFRGKNSAITEFSFNKKDGVEEFGKRIAFLAATLLPENVFIGGTKKDFAQKIADCANTTSTGKPFANEARAKPATIFERAVSYGAAIMSQAFILTSTNFFNTIKL